jgi:fused signal recognition particle receptor
MVTQTEYGMLIMIVGVFVALLFILTSTFVLKKSRNSLSDDKSLANTGVKTQDRDKDSSKSLIANSLKSTRGQFWNKLSAVLLSSEDEERALEQVEEILYLSDLGPRVVEHFLTQIRSLNKAQRKDLNSLKSFIQQEANQILSQVSIPKNLQHLELKNKPTVILIIGVNGAGKTTTIGKLAKLAVNRGLKVLVAAGDTFRAAAQEQLAVWAERAQVTIFAPEGVKDPGAVAFQAIKKSEAEDYDLVLIDTAGRLHTSHNLMEELKKVHKVIKTANSGAPHEVLLVLDASGGQNAVIQAEQFNQAVPVTGLILTKLDGTAKGGMVLSVVDKLKVPVIWLGVGEKADDLIRFDSEEFSKALVGDS